MESPLPYHPQTDRLVERFNRTLKQMLRRLIEDEGREWNKLLPYVLFEVPQMSTGFSPYIVTIVLPEEFSDL